MHTRGIHFLTTIGYRRLAAFVTALAALTALPALTVLAASDRGQRTLIDTSYDIGLFTRYLGILKGDVTARSNTILFRRKSQCFAGGYTVALLDSDGLKIRFHLVECLTNICLQLQFQRSDRLACVFLLGVRPGNLKWSVEVAENWN